MNDFFFKLKKVAFFCVCVGVYGLKGQTIEEAFLAAGENKNNLEKVLHHYKTLGEKQKYEAALFLIKNMPVHESQTYQWIDSGNNIVLFSEFNYEDFDVALQVFNKFKDSIGVQPKMLKEKDVKFISSELLIKNIDLAFKAWKNNPWSASYSFKTFCEYILPYRSLIEPLEEWREECNFLVQQAKYNLQDQTNPVEVCTNVMTELQGFSFRYTNSPIPAPLLSAQQLLFRREGSCPELANLAVLASRSIGIAVTFDFTPHYAASSNRHYWNTVIDKQGKAVPFNGSSASDGNGTPYNYDANNKRMAKVIRSTYAIQENALATHVKQQYIPNSYLRSKNIKDVTHEYVSVGEIKYNFSNSIDSIAYLNVFNNGRWNVIDWAKKENKYFKFVNIGRDLVYLPSYYTKGETRYAEYPILLNEEGKSIILKPKRNKFFRCTISRYNEVKNKYEENNSLHIEADENYTLFYWDGEWQKIGTSVATREGLYFKKIPSNSLLKLLPVNSDNRERIFLLNPENKKITWY